VPASRWVTSRHTCLSTSTSAAEEAEWESAATLAVMKRVLLTGMSGTGKSTVIGKLGELGYKAVDTDYAGFTVDVDSGAGTERLWREDRIQAVLSADDAEVLFISGTSRNQAKFYPQFDHIVLLSAPAHVLIERLTSRTNNPYGRNPEEIAETLRFVETVEPLLRASATLEIDTRAPLEDVIAVILDHVRP
jgi:shikimate kinase